MKNLLILFGCVSLCNLNATTTSTWIGSSGSNMSTSGNWVGGVVPANATTNIISFPMAGVSSTPNNNLGSNYLFNTINFTGHAYTLTGDSFLIPGEFGSTINFDITGCAIETTMNISASTAALNVYSTGINTIGNGSGGGLSGSGVLNVLKGQLNIGGTSTFNGTINITGSSSGPTILKAQATNALGTLGYTPLLVNLTEPGGTAYTATLDLNGYNQIIGGISGTTGTSIILGAANLTLNNFGSYSTPFYGTLTGTGTLTLQNNANAALLGNLTGFTGDVVLATGGSLFTNTLGGIGSFTVNAGGGTLQLMLGSSATMSNNLIVNDTLTFATNGQNINYTGTLSGSGTFIKLGAGTLTLSGANTNTGPFLIEGGTLNVNATTLPTGPITFEGYSGTLQAGSNLTLGQAVTISIGATIDTNTYDVTINGQVTGGAPLTKTGLGTLTLGSGGNNFTGRTTILEGILNGTSSTFPAGVAGIQQLVFQGTEVGTFQAGSDFTNFVPSIVFLGNGIIDTNTYDVTLNGVVSGSFPIIKAGEGTLTLANTGNNFTGNVQINRGTLSATPETITAHAGGMQQLIFAGDGTSIFQLGATFSDFTADIVLNSDGTFATQTYDITISGSLIGAPEHTWHKTGTGTVTFTGSGYFEGLINVLEGNAYANGLSSYDMTIHSGSTLRGTGVNSGTVTVLNGAILAPGNSVGTMTVGTLVLTSGSTTMIEIDDTAASSIDVTGSAMIAGALQIAPEVGAYPHQGRYLILSANSMGGTFSSVSSSPGFTFGLDYLSNEIYLNYLLAIPTNGLRGNACKVANYLNENAPASNGFTQLAMLSGDPLKEALNSVSPARNGFGTYIAAQTAFSLSNVLSTHLDGDRFTGKESSENDLTAMLTADSSDTIRADNQKQKNKFSTWITGFGEFAHNAAANQNPSFNFISEAVLAGFDYHLEDKGLAGASLGYAHTRYNENHHAGHGNINYYFASIYGNGFIGDFYLSPAVWGMFNQTNNTREISFPGFSDKAQANIFAWQLIPHLEAGYDIAFSWGDVVPFTSADFAISWQRGYSEHGASPFNAKQKANNSSMVRSETGLKFCEKWDYQWGSFSLREKASYIFMKPYGTGTVNTSFVGAPSSFTVASVNKNLNLGAIGINFVTAIGKKKPIKVELGYEGEFGVNYWSSDVTLTVNKDF